MGAKLEWRGTVDMGRNCTIYGNKVIQATVLVANYWAPVMETWAKQNAPWTDRTANARQSLHAWVEQLSKDTVAIYLSHGMYYGKYLEYRFRGYGTPHGRYAIIWPTIQNHLAPIETMLKGIFG